MMTILIQFYFIAVCAGAAYIHGIHEGMIMVQDFDLMHNRYPPLIILGFPGVRGHDWIDWYHVISPGRDALYILLGFSLATTMLFVGFTGIARLLPGTALLCWEFAEVGYAMARGGRTIFRSRGAPYEHVYFIVSIQKVTGQWVYSLHAFRIVIAITLLIGGMQ